MSIKDLVLFQKTYDYFLWIFPLINKFPKNQRFVLGQDMEREILTLIKLIHYFQKTSEKRQYILERISLHIDMMAIHIRLAKDLHFISVRHYGMGCDKINELGRLVTGLKKYIHTSHASKTKEHVMV